MSDVMQRQKIAKNYADALWLAFVAQGHAQEPFWQKLKKRALARLSPSHRATGGEAEGKQALAAGGSFDMLTLLVHGLTEPQALLFWTSPRVSASEKKKVLLATVEETWSLARAGSDGPGREELSQELVAGFLVQVLEASRMDCLRPMERAFQELVEGSSGVMTGTVSVAHEVSQEVLDAICSAAEKALGGSLVLESEVNEELMGGFVVRVKHRVFDGSLRGHLHKWRQSLDL